MSFILDALKKSEAERQRQNGPALLELRVTQPRRRYPVWALWVGVLLALNAAVLLYALLRRPEVPALRAPPSVAATASGAVAAPGTATATAPNASGPAAPGGQSVSAVAPLAPPPGQGGQGAAIAGSANPADDEPAVPASGSASAAGAADNPAPIAPANYASLPSLATLGGDLPSLQLNLLVSSDIASERYALVNMHRVREGDVLPEGPRVLAITREGVAMDYHGQQFMLRPSSNATP